MKIVRIIKNYGCKGYELLRQTPEQKGVFYDACFTEEPIATCDYLIVLNYSPNDAVIICPPDNMWSLVQEPDLPAIFPWVEAGHEQFARIYVPTERITGPKYIHSQTCLPWFNNDAGFSLDFLSSCKLPEKTRIISLISSSLSAFPGHLKRLDFIRYLQDQKPFVVDLYGRGINPIENKWDALAPYKYSIAIENTKLPHYWTEKLADCFLAYTLPIYYGADRLEEYFPADSFVKIDIEDFEGTIATIQKVLEDDIWEQRLPAIKEARELVLNKYQLFPFLAERIHEDQGSFREKKAVYLRGYNKETGYVKKPDQLFSVIVCTYNRAELLPECLLSLATQTFNPAQYEVVIVNNNSNDSTVKVAEEFVARFSNFRLVTESEQGLSHARNMGIREAVGEYLAFIDDDARAPDNWLETAARIVASHSPDIFGGPATPIFGCETPAWYRESYGIRGDMGETGWLKEGFIVGTNIFFRKELLEEYGGFDPELGMKGDSVGYHEETAIVYRAFAEGKKVYYSSELAVKDRIPDYKLSLAYYMYFVYKVGYDGVKLWESEADLMDLQQLGTKINDTFNNLDYALRKRDVGKYPYPENFVVETLGTNFVEIGKLVKKVENNEMMVALFQLKQEKSAFHLLDIICREIGIKQLVKDFCSCLKKKLASK